MHSGKGRVADGDLDPKYHDRSQRSSLYTIGEAQNASLGDNHGTIVQGPHFPEISTFGTKDSNIRDQLYIQGGKVKIYLGSDSQSPEMTLQRRGIIEVLSQLLSSILGWVPPPSNHTEGPLPSMAYDAAFLSTGQRESYAESQGVEPDSDIKTHPQGDGPDFSLLPLNDLDSQSLGLLDRPVPAEIYVGSMLSSGMGLACWNTKPHAGAVGPALGDVGTFSAQDGFIKIFNLWDDEKAIRTTSRTTGIGNYYIPPPMITKRTIQGRSRRGDIVKSLGIRGNAVYKSDFSDIKEFEIRCTSERGAALLLTSAADQEDLDDRQKLRKHILDYPELLYRHANAVRWIGEEESLYIISGSIKSDSCALAAFGEPTAPNEPAVVLANSTRPGQQISSWVWANQGTANTQLSDPSSLDSVKDQTLFLRGFKLDFSSSFRANLEHSAGPASGGGWNGGKSGDGDGERNGSRNEDTSKGGPGAGTGSNTGHGGSSFGGGVGALNSSSSRYRGKAVQLQSFPDSESRRRSCHPCDIINECLLKATGSSFALSHDDDWLPFLKDQSIWESTERSPLSVGGSSRVCVIQGVACFEAEHEVLGAAAQAVVSYALPSELEGTGLQSEHEALQPLRSPANSTDGKDGVEGPAYVRSSLVPLFGDTIHPRVMQDYMQTLSEPVATPARTPPLRQPESVPTIDLPAYTASQTLCIVCKKRPRHVQPNGKSYPTCGLRSCPPKLISQQTTENDRSPSKTPERSIEGKFSKALQLSDKSSKYPSPEKIDQKRPGVERFKILNETRTPDLFTEERDAHARSQDMLPTLQTIRQRVPQKPSRSRRLSALWSRLVN